MNHCFTTRTTCTGRTVEVEVQCSVTNDMICMSPSIHDRAPVAQLVEHRAVMREVVSSTPAGPTLRVLK